MNGRVDLRLSRSSRRCGLSSRDRSRRVVTRVGNTAAEQRDPASRGRNRDLGDGNAAARAQGASRPGIAREESEVRGVLLGEPQVAPNPCGNSGSRTSALGVPPRTAIRSSLDGPAKFAAGDGGQLRGAAGCAAGDELHLSPPPRLLNADRAPEKAAGQWAELTTESRASPAGEAMAMCSRSCAADRPRRTRYG
jgi:hypothetical protein